MVDRFADSGVEVELRVDPDLTLPRDLDLAAYRIVQEGLTNTLKHAAPCSATVSVRRDGRSVVVEVSDTGPGVGHQNRPRSRAGRDRRTGLDGRWGVGARQRGERRVRLAGDAAPTPLGAVAMTIRVLIADDDALLRAGLAVVLGTAPDLDVVAEAGDGLQAVDLPCASTRTSS